MMAAVNKPWQKLMRMAIFFHNLFTHIEQSKIPIGVVVAGEGEGGANVNMMPELSRGCHV